MKKGRFSRILVLSASVGAGHVRAAEAVALALRKLCPRCSIEAVDVLGLASKTFRRLYGKGYLDFANRAPHLLGFVYDVLDRPAKEKPPASPLRIALEKQNLKPFLKLLAAEPWALVINTHFLPAEIIAALRRSRRIGVPQMTVVTDFMVHRLWVQEPCERYFLASAESAAYASALGIPAERITVTGIPIHPVFGRPLSVAEARRELAVAGGRPLILVLSGGFGVGPVEAIVQAVQAIERPLDIVVVCGRNAALEQRLTAQPPRAPHRVRTLGYTPVLDRWLAAADLVISKPGGLTASEILARGAAFAIVNPIPGQESRNADYLLENGAAVKIGPLATLPWKIETLLSDPARLRRLRRQARRLARPGAAFEIARRALAFLDAPGSDSARPVHPASREKTWVFRPQA